MLCYLSRRQTIWTSLRLKRVDHMIANIVIGAAIFGYATWALVKFINKSKKGKCAACDLKNSALVKVQCSFSKINKYKTAICKG